MCKVSAVLLLVFCFGCGEGMIEEKLCFAPTGEYVARPFMEMNNCFPAREIPRVMFLNTDKLDIEYLACGDHVMLESTFPQGECVGHQRKTLKSTEKGFSGTLKLEVDCGDHGKCMTFWSLEFRRLEDKIE